jgi:ubiquinol-cytochrome c reductase cytochrome b subunit
MSFWGATVITNMASAIPYIGTELVQFFWGGFAVDNPTLNRFFSIHYLLPFIIAALVVVHLLALHTDGSNNPLGLSSNSDKLSFHPYFTIKDLLGFILFFIFFGSFVFFAPNVLGHSDNYIEADPLVTPTHIVPEWYFLPFYAILRGIPNKLLGVVGLLASILVLLLLPFISTSRIRSSAYRPISRVFFWVFVFNFLLLGWLGAMPAEEPYVVVAQVATAYHFVYFLVLIPLLG